MRGFWLLVHFLGFTLWLGGGIATMIAVVISGVVLLLNGPYMHSGDVPGWLTIMMAAGILGGIAAVTISVPTAGRLGRLEVGPRGELPESFQGLRKRQIMAATIAGSLGLIALFAGTLGRG